MFVSLWVVSPFKCLHSHWYCFCGTEQGWSSQSCCALAAVVMCVGECHIFFLDVKSHNIHGSSCSGTAKSPKTCSWCRFLYSVMVL